MLSLILYGCGFFYIEFYLTILEKYDIIIIWNPYLWYFSAFGWVLLTVIRMDSCRLGRVLVDDPLASRLVKILPGHLKFYLSMLQNCHGGHVKILPEPLKFYLNLSGD